MVRTEPLTQLSSLARTGATGISLKPLSPSRPRCRIIGQEATLNEFQATHSVRTLVLFNYDWDLAGFARNAQAWPHDVAGFDLFSFPSNAHLAWFDMARFVDRLARQAKRRGERHQLLESQRLTAATSVTA